MDYKNKKNEIIKFIKPILVNIKIIDKIKKKDFNFKNLFYINEKFLINFNFWQIKNKQNKIQI